FAHHAEVAHGADRDLAQRMVFTVGERLAWRDDDALARMDAHGVEVFHVAYHDAVVEAVAHDLVLELLPADQVLLDKDLGAVGERPCGAQPQLRLVGAAARAQAAERVSRAQHDRIADSPCQNCRFLQRVRRRAARHFDPDLGEPRAEESAVLGFLDGADRRSQHRDPEALEHAAARELQAAVEGGLAAEAERDRIRALALDHLGDELRGHRQEIDPVGERRRSLHGGDVRVHQHRADALLGQRLDRLAARIVEFAGLADLERAAAEQQHLRRHGLQDSLSTKRSNSAAQSTGPGAASGWNCTLKKGFERWRMPSFEPSLALVYQGSQPEGSDAASTAKPWFCEVMKQRSLPASRQGWLWPRWPNLSL